MTDFASRLRSEIEYAGLSQKEFAAKAGLKKRALDAYLREQQSMPPADTAVKMAAVLGLSVEYLITGKAQQKNIDISNYLKFRGVLDDLTALPEALLFTIKSMIGVAADIERKKAGK